mmetsp:Transcript_112217/g.317889  ORF Transcript_112217/g.317889 Transcript_112217/m.317889 type:complete len:456 (-) Transcript_112217:623-1990(-)
MWSSRHVIILDCPLGTSAQSLPFVCKHARIRPLLKLKSSDARAILECWCLRHSSESSARWSDRHLWILWPLKTAFRGPQNFLTSASHFARPCGSYVKCDMRCWISRLRRWWQSSFFTSCLWPIRHSSTEPLLEKFFASARASCAGQRVRASAVQAFPRPELRWNSLCASRECCLISLLQSTGMSWCSSWSSRHFHIPAEFTPGQSCRITAAHRIIAMGLVRMSSAWSAQWVNSFWAQAGCSSDLCASRQLCMRPSPGVTSLQKVVASSMHTSWAADPFQLPCWPTKRASSVRQLFFLTSKILLLRHSRTSPPPVLVSGAQSLMMSPSHRDEMPYLRRQSLLLASSSALTSCLHGNGMSSSPPWSWRHSSVWAASHPGWLQYFLIAGRQCSSTLGFMAMSWSSSLPCRIVALRHAGVRWITCCRRQRWSLPGRVPLQCLSLSAWQARAKTGSASGW